MDIVDGLNDRQKEALLETEGPVKYSHIKSPIL